MRILKAPLHVSAFLAALLAAPAAHAAVAVDYVMYVGGAKIGTLTLSATLERQRYQLETRIKTEEVAGTTEDATLTLFAAGAQEENAVKPQIFTSDYVTASGLSSQLQITFNETGPASVLALPPPKRKPDLLSDFHKKGALDPVSALLALSPELSAASKGAPCGAPVPVFDGWRRFDITVAYEGETNLEADEGYSGPAHKCEGRLTPVAGYSADAMTRLKEDPQRVEVWLAPLNAAGFLVPVRIIAPTPYGGAVIRSTEIREY
ncbi:DUF3108 domain-containing protein [Pyruvatibacter mobilis]|uniref:DUF3108 domain-containing protein n=1 Tax=Pyruvatibacter mobilis TaxID=1712261 RepID=UPI00042094ED